MFQGLKVLNTNDSHKVFGYTSTNIKPLDISLMKFSPSQKLEIEVHLEHASPALHDKVPSFLKD